MAQVKRSATLVVRWKHQRADSWIALLDEVTSQMREGAPPRRRPPLFG